MLKFCFKILLILVLIVSWKKEEKSSKNTNVALEKQKALNIQNTTIKSMKETGKRKCDDEPKERNWRRSLEIKK